MSLENSQYTFATLRLANRDELKREVDRVVKEADQVRVEDASIPVIPSKRLRFSQIQNSDISSRGYDHHQICPVSGIILEIELLDFLSHSKMGFELNKNINLIVGLNGSGKSAILTALVVALGGNATTTGRGTALKDFVKWGAKFARVTCVVNNAGALTYKRDLYGNKIIVIRTLQSEGGSSIKLKSERGTLISSKMEDLRAMTLQLGIQVDNPISVLDQNYTKQFLKDSKPQQIFDLFMKATNLQTLEKLYLVEIPQSLAKINQEIKKKEQQLIDSNIELEEARKKYAMFEDLEKDRAKDVILKMELLWAEVRDCMIALELVQAELYKVQEEKQSLDNNFSSEEQTERLLQQIESLKAKLISLVEQKQQQESEIKNLKSVIVTVLQKQKKSDQDKKKIQAAVREGEREIGEYKIEIQRQIRKMLPEHVAIRHKQREEILELEKTVNQLKNDRTSVEAEITELHSKARNIRAHVMELERSKRHKEENLRKLITELRGLQATNSKLPVYGPCIPDLVHQIERNNRFKKKPIGPLGAYVKVKDPKWTLAIECAMKNRLGTFVVDNTHDERLLKDMISRIVTHGQKPSTIRFTFPTNDYDVSRTSARTPEFPNILDVVEISNVVARATLVEKCRIEQTLLIPRDDQCFSLLSQVPVPPNCYKAFTLNGDCYNPAPQFSTYAAMQRSARCLQVSCDDVIRETVESIRTLESSILNDQQSISLAQREQSNGQNQLQKFLKEMSTISDSTLQTIGKLEKLKDLEQPDTNSISDLREELTLKEKNLQVNKEMLTEFPSKIIALEEEKQVLKQKEIELQDKCSEIDDRINTIEKEQISCQVQLNEKHSAKVGNKCKLKQLRKQEESLNQKLIKLQKQCDTKRAAAEKFGDHVRREAEAKQEKFLCMENTKRPTQTIDQELRTLQRKLIQVEKVLGENAEVTASEFKKKEAATSSIRSKITHLKSNAKHVRSAIAKRKELLGIQKKFTSCVISHQFTRVLNYRNCVGRVKFNFEQKTLDIHVGPVDEGEMRGFGTSSLSGGERSYATVAFLLALWCGTDLPFYFLDEPLVYLDEVNQQTALSELIKFARQKCYFQFGFLTPLNIGGIKSDDQLSIFRLDPPRA